MSDTAGSDDSRSQGLPPSTAVKPKLDASSLIKAIHEHRRMPRDEPGYWDQYCTLISSLCRAGATLFVRRESGDNWTLLGRHGAQDDWLMQVWNESIIEHGQRSLQNGFAFIPVQDDRQRLHILTMVRAYGIGDALLVMDIPERERAQLNELILRALLATDFPERQSDAPLGTASEEKPQQRLEESVLKLLDLAAQVLNEERFDAAALVLVNGLAAYYRSAQVALGWLQGDSMRVVAVSHLDRFERNTQSIRLLEDIFLETLGEEGEAWFPGSRSNSHLLALQEELAKALEFAEQCSIPVRDGNGITRAAVFLGFQQQLGDRPQAGDLLLIMDLLQPWLQYLRGRERWWGARLATTTRSHIERFVGPGHVWGRAAALFGTALLLFLIFGKWDYRVESQAQLTTDSTRIISTQIDGRVEEVFASAGDLVKEGAVLATLDTRDLRQQEMDAKAERQRLSAEADKARAAGNLAELAIADARYAQAEAKLTRILQYLEQSRFIAPFDSVVIDGERKELLSSPVKKGDKLFRLARTEGLYVELLVQERDIRYVKPDATGELRLLSRPDQKIPFKLSVFIPVAQVKGQEGNHFLIKAKLQQSPEDWWRTGMSGTALIDGGKQKKKHCLILTHRAIDTLWMKLWWLW